MTIAHGRPYLAIPGPSVMPDRVLNAMHRAAPNIYEGEIVEMVKTLWPDLKRLAGTQHHAAIYIGNGHAAWEASIANTFSRGDQAVALATGRFGEGWAAHAVRMGVDVAVTDFGKSSPVVLERVEAALRARPDARAVMMTHVDTATGAKNDVAGVRRVMDALGHEALLMVDCIASFGCDAFHMDDWGVDVMVAASQKGLMTPPGLGLMFASDRALARFARADLNTPYWEFAPRVDAAHFYMHFYGTAPTHHLFGLRAALDMIMEEGIDAVWARHTALARAVWAAAGAWGQGGDFRLNIADPASRGHSVTAMRLSGADGTRLRRWTEHEAGVTLGIGLGMAEPDSPEIDAFFRLAHMGHVNAHMTLGALAVIDAGMKALEIAHGPGALDAAARVLAEA